MLTYTPLQADVIKRLVMLGDQGATLSSHKPLHISTSSKQNRTLFLLKQESNPREPQPLDNGGYQTAQHSWVQMTHFTRPWSQHTRARDYIQIHTRSQGARSTAGVLKPTRRQRGVPWRSGEERKGGTTRRKGNCTAHEGGGWKWPIASIFIYLKVLI